MTMRIMIRPMDHGGLGATVRCTKLAKEMVRFDSSLNILFTAHSPGLDIIRSEGFRVVSLPKEKPIRADKILRTELNAFKSFKPDVVVKDGIYYPPMLLGFFGGVPDVLITDIYSDDLPPGFLRLLSQFSMIIVPYPHDFWPIPPSLGNKVSFVGSMEITENELNDLRPSQDIRRELGVGEDEQLISVTAGSGGLGGYLHITLALSFMEIKKQLPKSRMVLLLGPMLPLSERNIVRYLGRITDGLIVKGWVKSLLEILSASDLVIARGGSTLMQAAAVGTPCISVPYRNPGKLGDIIFDDHRRRAQKLEEIGTLSMMLPTKCTPERLAKWIVCLLKDDERRKRMSEIGKKLVDGRGCRKAANLIFGLGAKTR